MQPKDIDFDKLYQMIFSVPDYMSITGIDLEPTMRVHIVSDLNIISDMEYYESNKELQRLIKVADSQQRGKSVKMIEWLLVNKKQKYEGWQLKIAWNLSNAFCFFSDSMRITARVLVEVPKNVLVAGWFWYFFKKYI